MYDAIKNFNKQFDYNPEIENQTNWSKFEKFLVVGMGGSHLAADILKLRKPELNITIHSNYGLPFSMEMNDTRERLIILSSYSGNTEEVIDAFGEGLKGGLNMSVISIGGQLIELAQKHNIPYVQMPDTGIQPRMALGFSLKALLKIMGEEKTLQEVSALAGLLNPLDYQKDGEELSKKLSGKIPIIYSSQKYASIAYNWKIKFNETGKIPAFYNIFPELNHNEMTGFDVKESTKSLSEKFYFIFLKDRVDDSRIIKRMDVLRDLYKERGLPAEIIELQGKNIWQKIFSSLMLADWTAYYTAEQYGVESEQVPMVEEFKKLIA